MKFHITVTNNETGEVLHDTDACAIIAGINEGEESAVLTMTDCGPIDLAQTLSVTNSAVERVARNHPEIKALAELLPLLAKREQAEATETEETNNEE